MIVKVIVAVFSVFVGLVVGISQHSYVAGLITAILWPFGLAISIYEWISGKISNRREV